ncbi:hypothetical protein PMZ80_010330 [Knufia obscura]|uniref:Major facilitator superfamily (MFS) profile domain-containing protein n=2 Tax=Knufia TaxID=430999 RepID=A0AAN8EIU0_9EURO|nr:hypothetical protein PMZ80_010330 [Knufia obscura]KAK5951837.1 hypothetical protein OHC33_007129 [Knufia fluminis]
MSVFPYSYRMIESFNVTHDETRISIYAGMLITAFAFAEFSTGMIWGRISDRIGRRPVLICGLVGTSISMLCFGFSTNLWTAIISRALGGFLNGNVGVLQTTVAELVKKKEHQPRAYSIMPFVWCLGSIIGPAMGGALAMPCDSYPSVFPRGGLFDQYPFLLPNLVCVVVLLLGIVNGALFIDETHPDLKHKQDKARQLGQYLTGKLSGVRSTSMLSEKFGNSLDFDPPPGYRSTESSPLMSSSPPPAVTIDPESTSTKEDRGLASTFTKQVAYVILGYGILAFHSVSFDALMPIMLSEKPSNTTPSLPFKFTGGLGMSTKSIGFMLAVQGVYSMIAQLWFFPVIVKKLGTLTAFRMVMLVWPLLYLAVPYIVLLPHWLQNTGVYAAMLIKITFHVIAFPSNAILLANAAPSKAVLGTINGVAASTACLCRAFGPTVSGSIHSAGLRLGYNGFAWWAAGLVCVVGALEAYCIKDTESSHECATDNEEDQAMCEPLITATVEDPEGKTDECARIEELDLNIDVKTDHH